MHACSLHFSQVYCLDPDPRLLSKVEHENIVRVTHFYDEYLQNGNVFMVEELITGGELFHRIVRLDHYSEIDAIELVVKILQVYKNSACVGNTNPIQFNSMANTALKSKNGSSIYEVLHSHRFHEYRF